MINPAIWMGFSVSVPIRGVVTENMEPCGVGGGVSPRYAVVRRSPRNPIFHPFFFDYGGDKMSFFVYLRSMKRECGMRG